MKLEIGHFSVKDVRFGEKTAFADGILTVNREEAIAALNKDGKLKNVSLHIARPGDSTRIIPAKAAAGVRCRPDGRCVFSGYTGEVAQAGSGVTYALDGMCVLGAGLHSRQGMNGMVDMSGGRDVSLCKAHQPGVCSRKCRSQRGCALYGQRALYKGFLPVG